MGAWIGAAACAAPPKEPEAPVAAKKETPRSLLDLDVALLSSSSSLPNASGAVQFRQPPEKPGLIRLEASVRGLAANAKYQVQRAVDTRLDGVCTSREWLTLGADNMTPRTLDTDAQGSGRVELTRMLPPSAKSGDGFDIAFRVVEADSNPPLVVLESGCHRYVVR